MNQQQQLYQQVILDHNKKPRNFRVMEDATHRCQGHNPLCGDQIVVYLKVEDGRVADVSFEGSGCAISKASASMMTQRLEGRTVEEAETMFTEFHDMILGTFDPDEVPEHHLGKLKLFKGVRDYPSRTKCATLAWHAVKGALSSEEEISTE